MTLHYLVVGSVLAVSEQLLFFNRYDALVNKIWTRSILHNDIQTTANTSTTTFDRHRQRQQDNTATATHSPFSAGTRRLLRRRVSSLRS